jgi:hypothetical protein
VTISVCKVLSGPTPNSCVVDVCCTIKAESCISVSPLPSVSPLHFLHNFPNYRTYVLHLSIRSQSSHPTNHHAQPIITPNQPPRLRMCVKPIQFSCGAVSHITLRDYEARFLTNPRPAHDACDCDRLMDAPRLMARKCETCERKTFTIPRSTEIRAGAHELTGRDWYEARGGC